MIGFVSSRLHIDSETSGFSGQSEGHLFSLSHPLDVHLMHSLIVLEHSSERHAEHVQSNDDVSFESLSFNCSWLLKSDRHSSLLREIADEDIEKL